mmetsp:Transcript_15815/g.33213  ORF Transcript_15815/g.33213 Transcript_15815/m.33213 type:complete len:135 (-) Transcript_15815:32-436(-)
MRKIIAISAQQIVALHAKSSILRLEATPLFKFGSSFGSVAQKLDFYGVNSTGRSEFLGVAPLYATAEEIFFSKDDEGRVREDVDDMLRAQELGGEGASHAVGEIVYCKVDFVGGSRHYCCVGGSRGKRASQTIN